MPTYEYVGNIDLYAGGFWDAANTGAYDTNFADGHLFSRDTRHGRFNLAANTTEAWFHFTFYKLQAGGSAAGDAVLDCRDDNGTTIFDFRNNGSGNETQHNIRHYDGGLTTTGSLDMPDARRYTYDIYINNASGGAGEFRIYRDDQPEYIVTGLNGTGVFINNFRCWNAQHDLNSFRTDYYYSEFLVGIGANSPTVGRRVYTSVPTGDSAINTAWTGTFADVDDDNATNDGNLVYTEAAANRQGFTFPAGPVLNSEIEGVGFSTRGYIGDGAGLDYGHSIRSGGTDYDQGVLGVDQILQTYITTVFTNPDTGNPWTIAELNSAEFGIVSA